MKLDAETFDPMPSRFIGGDPSARTGYSRADPMESSPGCGTILQQCAWPRIAEVNLDLVILLVMGIATGLISSWLAWRGPAFSLAGTSPLATVTQLVTGWTLLGVGLASRARRPSSSFGWLLAPGGHRVVPR